MLGHNGIGMVSKDCSNYFLNYLKIHENNTFYFKKFIFNINKINRFLLSKHPSIITSCLKLACICVKNLLMSSTHVCLYLWDIDFHPFSTLSYDVFKSKLFILVVYGRGEKKIKKSIKPRKLKKKLTGKTEP